MYYGSHTTSHRPMESAVSGRFYEVENANEKRCTGRSHDTPRLTGSAVLVKSHDVVWTNGKRFNMAVI